MTFFYLDSINEGFNAVAETVLLTLKMAGIEIHTTLTWDTVYHHGYTKNPFDELVERTYADTRSKNINNIMYNTIESFDC